MHVFIIHTNILLLLFLLPAVCSAHQKTYDLSEEVAAPVGRFGEFSSEKHLHAGCGFHNPSDHELQEIIKREELSRRRHESGFFFVNFVNWFLCLFNPFPFCDGSGTGTNSTDEPGIGPPARNIVVKVYVHNFYRSDNVGYLTDAEVVRMMDQTNDLFSGTGFAFSLVDIFRDQNDEWFNSAAYSQEEYSMMALTRMGGPETLNIYLKNTYKIDSGSGQIVDLCGYAYLAEAADRVGPLDAVSVAPWCALYDRSKIVAHEIGHFLNLLHTFNPNCFSQGDLVSDTPSQSEPIGNIQGACPSPYPDTCPSLPGRDPIDNIMVSLVCSFTNASFITC